MVIKTGCDIVDIRKFKISARNGGGKFMENIFSTHELSGTPKTETLAGIFAAKEAVVKALELKAGRWKSIEIIKNKNGRPEAVMMGCNKNIASHDISISHDGDYAFATVIFLIEL